MACETSNQQDKKKLSLDAVAVEIIETSGTCTLITIDEKGQPRARIMDPFPPEDQFVIWFGTNVQSRKVEEVYKNNKTTVNYYDKEGNTAFIIACK